MKRFLFFLFFACWVAPAFAVHPPQAKLFDTKSSPDCLLVRPSWLANVPQGAGDISGAAVSVTNQCLKNIVVTDVRISPSDETIVGAVMATKANGYIQYIGLRRFRDGIDCFADAPPKETKDLRCKSMTVRPEDTLIVPVPWGTHYDISGRKSWMDLDVGMPGSKQQDAFIDAYGVEPGSWQFRASGWMLNPADPKQVMDVLMKGSGASPPQ